MNCCNPSSLPQELKEKIQELKNSKNKNDCLQKAYDFVTSNVGGRRFAVLTSIHNLFITNPNKLWNKNKRLLCTNLNKLMKVMLVESGFFKNEDVKTKWTMIWIVSPHQYLRVRMGKNKYTNVDIWGKNFGIKLGDYARGFH